ncbi:phage tail tape measure protein [Aureimonas sp. AU20]|uniref:phage tail tape measure protein n=1 Tax=Aureimonas sp. AU20 TaxID=1349819 RepID=UPI000722E289|nr:phage tail tape measure protein [Aureimonas sp. AU20]ALN73185.1 hypothetical protein M673_10670 [Aureimonas sp. AU20]
MARGAQTTLTLRLIDAVSAPARAARAALAGLNAGIGALQGSGNILAAAGRNAQRDMGRVAAAGTAAGAGLAAGALAIVSTEKALNAAAAAGNLSMKDRADVYDNAIRLNYDYGGSVRDVINANTELLRSGLDLQNSKAALPDSLNLAQATGENSVDTTRAIVTNLTALGLQYDQTAAAADRFVQALDRTAGVNLIDFETSGKYFNPVAAATGMSADETMAMQIEMAKRGISGSSAGTGLRAGPASILAPTKKALGAYARLKLDPRQFQGDRKGDATAEQILGVLEARGANTEGVEAAVAAIVAAKAKDSDKANRIVRDLGDQLGAVTAEDRAEMVQAVMAGLQGGARRADVPGLVKELQRRGAGFADFEAIFGRNHASKFLGFNAASYDEELGLMRTQAPGSTDRKSKMMMQGLPGDVNNAEGALQGLIAALSKAGGLSDLSKGFRAAAEALTTLSDQNPALLRFGTLAAAAVAALAPLGFMAGSAGAAIGLLINPVSLAGAAIAGLVGMNLKPVTNGLRTFSNALRRSIDLTIIRGMQAQGEAAREWLSSFRAGRLAFNRVGDDLGRALGRGVNAAARALPQLRAAAGALASLGQTALAALGPRLTPAISSLRDLAETFAAPKIEAALRLGEALKQFGANASAAIGPALAAGISIVSTSFGTLTAGAEAVIRTLNAVQTGMVAFASGLLEAISPDALASASRGLSALADAASRPVALLGDGFRAISNAVAGSTDSLAAFASSAGASVGAGINAAVAALANGRAALAATWSAITGLFDEMGRFVPDFGPLVGAIQSAIGSIVSVLERVGSAVSAARSAISGLAGGGAQQAATAGAAIGGMAAPMQGPPMPRRAGGGSVRRGPVLVGERGPEVLNLGGNGYVTPNHKLGGGGDTISIHVNGAGDPEAVANRVMQKLNRKVQRSRQIGMNR